MEEIKRSAVHSQTAAMLEMGTNLLSQSAEQTRKLTDVETQVSPSRRARETGERNNGRVLFMLQNI